MKDGKPETLEEALRLIEEQNRHLSEKENQLEQKSFKLEQKENQLNQKAKELDAANKEILRANKEILEKIAEIKILNEKLAVKRAREWVARTEAMTKLLKDQPLLFDAEELGIKIENPCPSPSDEEISQAETDEDSSSEEKKTKKSGKGRKSVSTINNLAKARVVIDLTDEEKICPNCGSQMKKVYTVTSERLVHIPAREYIEVVIRNVYECQNCLDENDRPVTKAAQDKQIIGRSIGRTCAAGSRKFLRPLSRSGNFWTGNLRKESSFSLTRHRSRFSNTAGRKPRRNTGTTDSAGKKKPRTETTLSATCGSFGAGPSIPSTHTISDGLAAGRTYFRSSKDLRAM